MAEQRQEHLTSLLLEGSGEAKYDVVNIHVVICAFQYGLFIWTGVASLLVHLFIAFGLVYTNASFIPVSSITVEVF